jgi:Fur family ferric uptake transcriptional regulator
MTHCHTWVETLRELGHRITPQREMIIETLLHGDDHMTADQIFARLKTRTSAINLATVYRTLDLLVERGLATRTSAWNGKAVYASMEHGPHVHLVCRSCGKVSFASHQIIIPIDSQLEQQYQFAADFQHVAIFGLCQACQNHDSRA